MKRKSVAILGAGNMGCAIAEGMLSGGLVSPENLILSRRNASLLESFRVRGCRIESDAEKACQIADAVILAVKPQMIGDLFSAIRPFSVGKLMISIAAGVTVATIEEALPGCPVVRVMPNTPLMVACGVSALCKGESVDTEDAEFAEKIFSCAGSTIWCAESLLNPMTALTSSSVAYFARMMQDMCSWAAENGFDSLSEKEVTELVSMTALGTAKLILEKEMSPAALVRAVASPNGTTERALNTFDRCGLDETITSAMDACLARANELSCAK